MLGLWKPPSDKNLIFLIFHFLSLGGAKIVFLEKENKLDHVGLMGYPTM